jgi:hypothetical protein
MNQHRPYYDEANDEYWPIIHLFNEEGKLLPEDQQVPGKAITGAEAKKRGWL